MPAIIRKAAWILFQAHLEAVGCGHGYERVIVARLNAYLDDALPPSEFRFVYLDCPLDKPKLRPDIATVHKDCLSQEVQTKRRQRETNSDPIGSDAEAGTSDPQHATNELQEPVHTNLDVRMLPTRGRKPVSVAQTTVLLSQMQLVVHQKAKSAPTRLFLPRLFLPRLFLPRKAKGELGISKPSGSTPTEQAAPIIFYSDIVALVEVTFKSKSMSEEMIQAADYVRETRFSQPFRRFVPCLFMNHCTTSGSKKEWHFRVVHFDPAGYWCNGPHRPCSVNKGDFSSVLRYLTSGNIGYPRATALNPPCHISSQKRHPVTIPVGGKCEVTLIEILWIQKNLTGRCTFVYLAAEDGGPPFVIKESWPDSNRTNEVEFLKLAADRKVPNIALLHSRFFDADPSAFIVTTVNAVRNVNETTVLGNRRAVRIPLDRQGFPIEEAESPLLIVAIMYCAISAIRGLSKNLPPLRALNHRDISLSNILLSERDWNRQPLSGVAFLTDLDNADYYVAGGGYVDSTDDKLKGKVSASGESQVEHLRRTGTLLYMFQEALIAARGFRHLPRHDLESVYYVAVILACLQADGAIPVELHSMWTQGDLASIGCGKLPSILGPSDTLQWLAPRHQILKDHFRTTFLSFLTFFITEGHYTKSVADQLSEDSLLDDLLQKLEELDRSMRSTS